MTDTDALLELAASLTKEKKLPKRDAHFLQKKERELVPKSDDLYLSFNKHNKLKAATVVAAVEPDFATALRVLRHIC